MKFFRVETLRNQSSLILLIFYEKNFHPPQDLTSGPSVLEISAHFQTNSLSVIKYENSESRYHPGPLPPKQ